MRVIALCSASQTNALLSSWEEQRITSGCSWSWACLGRRRFHIYSTEQRKRGVFSQSCLCVTAAGMQNEMENRPSSYHLITGNSSHCAEEITAAYDCLLPIHVTMMVQRETVC